MSEDYKHIRRVDTYCRTKSDFESELEMAIGHKLATGNEIPHFYIEAYNKLKKGYKWESVLNDFMQLDKIQRLKAEHLRFSSHMIR